VVTVVTNGSYPNPRCNSEHHHRHLIFIKLEDKGVGEEVRKAECSFIQLSLDSNCILKAKTEGIGAIIAAIKARKGLLRGQSCFMPLFLDSVTPKISHGATAVSNPHMCCPKRSLRQSMKRIIEPKRALLQDGFLVSLALEVRCF
jgi:hypothetical protein